MTFEDNLKAQFAAISPPPSRLTTSDAVRLGRRSQRIYRLAASGITAVVVIATVSVTAWGATSHPSTTGPSQKHRTHPSTASQLPTPSATAAGVGPNNLLPAAVTYAPNAPTCPATSLGTQPGVVASIYAPAFPESPAAYATGQGLTSVDPTGHYLLGSANNTFLYHDGVPTIIQVPAEISKNGNMLAAAVNQDGVVVGGVSEDHGVDPRTATGWAFKWRSGVMTRLPMPDIAHVLSATASAINTEGDIVGSVTIGSAKTGDVHSRPVEWPAATPAAVTLLNIPRNLTSGYPESISDAGNIVGELDTPAGKSAGLYVWGRSGKVNHLVEASHFPNPAVMPFANMIVGYTGPAADGNDAAAELNTVTGSVAHVPGYRLILTANARGDFIGLQNTVGKTPAEAVVISGRAVRLATPPGDTGPADPFAIANDGTVVGVILQGNGKFLPNSTNYASDIVEWHC